MKKTLTTLMLVVLVSLNAECINMPIGMELEKTIEAKDVSKSKELLVQYKKDVAAYVKTCDNKQEKFEETSVMIHTYEARLEDIEHDLNKVAHGTDCSKVPSSSELEQAFKEKNDAHIKTHYASYKETAKQYIAHCTTHPEYETVFESSMFCDEMYDEWIAKNKS
jgi:septal ring factor EnvC (AmiA/AmiB activator)